MYKIIKASLWNIDGKLELNSEIFEELQLHAISSIPAPILSHITMSSELQKAWRNVILQQVAYYSSYKYSQSKLPINVPYVILKGTSAAQYYPHPEFRTMGDIDIMTRREDYDTAYNQLKEAGYYIVDQKEREVTFRKNNIMIELHRCFSSFNDPKQSEYLDDLIVKNITPSHVLPDLVNGLVLLEHISQHLENGLGLRQIIDWMMFVDKCLPDEKWLEFEPLSERIGLKKLAITVTRMCEIYLGLPERKWCKVADEMVCKNLIDYVLSCGNFGSKWKTDNDVGKRVLTYTRGPISTIKWLQERGMVNWKAAQKRKILRNFAWLYQAIRYVYKGVSQEGSFLSVKEEYLAAKKRNLLFNSLGVKQKSKGLVVYRNGKYVKK